MLVLDREGLQQCTLCGVWTGGGGGLLAVQVTDIRVPGGDHSWEHCSMRHLRKCTTSTYRTKTHIHIQDINMVNSMINM